MANYFEKYDVQRPSKIAPPKPLPEQPAEQQAGLWPVAKSAMQTADDFVRSMANAATFGGTDWLESKFGSKEETAKKTAEAKERSPVASVAGEVAGVALPISRVSRGVGAAIPMLAKPGFLRSAAREGTAGALVSGAQQAAETGKVDPSEVALTGIATGAPYGVLAKKLSPYTLTKAVAKSMPEGGWKNLTAHAMKQLSPRAKAKLLDDPELLKAFGVQKVGTKYLQSLLSGAGYTAGERTSDYRNK